MPIGIKISGAEIDSYFEDAITNRLDDLFSILSNYNGDILFEQWTKLIQSIDELINIPGELEEDEFFIFLSLKINTDTCNDPHYYQCLDILEKNFNINVAKRVGLLICQSASIIYSLRHNGIDIPNITNYLDLVKFFQSRRKYYVAFLALIKQHSKGSKTIEYIDLLNYFQYHIEVALMGITTAFNFLTINKCIDGFSLTATEKGFRGNYKFNQLDNFFLEPTRTSIVDQQTYSDEYNELDIIVKKKGILYSPSELDDMIHNTIILFDCYGITSKSAFQELLGFIESLKPYYQDNYFISIPEGEFEELFQNNSHLAYHSYDNNYFDILNSHVPFYKHKNLYISNIFLVIRYFTYTIQGILDKTKRYQIRSGFIFEQQVSSILGRHGFRDREIKRINRKEFDVVCTKDNCIYNFQCKNNLFNIATIDTRNYNLVASCNRKLVNYYKQAYLKEINREQLLLEKLNLRQIKHFVISRFPVISIDNEFIINFNELEFRLQSGLL